MPTRMMTAREGGDESPTGGDVDEEQRQLALARLSDLDVLTADDEEEIGRFRAFVAGPSPQHRLIPWARRRPALGL